MKWQTTLRTRGRVLLPKELRESKGWSADMWFKIEECEEGVFLRYLPPPVKSGGKKVTKRKT